MYVARMKVDNKKESLMGHEVPIEAMGKSWHRSDFMEWERLSCDRRLPQQFP